MKKATALVLVLVCVWGLVGCTAPVTEGSILLKEGTVKSISVTSYPGSKDYSFSGEDAQAIIDYLSGLRLYADFSENPDRLVGYSWEILIHYEDGDSVEIIHCVQFIRRESDRWYKMDYEEGQFFDTLLYELSKDNE